MLQSLCTELKKELKSVLEANKITSFTMKPVKRSYAFERADIPRGQQYVLKISYPFAGGRTLPHDLKGKHFSALLGTQTRCAIGKLPNLKVTFC